MVCEVDIGETIIVELFHLAVSFPEYSIAKSWDAVLLARVVIVCSHVELVCGFEVDFAFLELSEQYILVPTVHGPFLAKVEFVESHY